MHSLKYSSHTAELSKHPSVFHNFPPLMQMGHQMHSLQYSSLTAELSKHPSVFHYISLLHPFHTDWPPNVFSKILESYCRLSKHPSVFHNIPLLHPPFTHGPPNAFSAILESYCRIEKTSLNISQ